ncbi:hypothetical protein LCGC14_0338290 [marine sediment metagenome]|uniref:Uncharacterized protein n=1 Tax=marine sediment metagenome TaxID=412755 RepID=A0A0F9TEH8_9ZZZZ
MDKEQYEREIENFLHKYWSEDKTRQAMELCSEQINEAHERGLPAELLASSIVSVPFNPGASRG